MRRLLIARITRFRSPLLELLRRGRQLNRGLVGTARVGAWLRRLLASRKDRARRDRVTPWYRSTADTRPLVHRRPTETSGFRLQLGFAPIRLAVQPRTGPGATVKTSEAGRAPVSSPLVLPPTRTILAAQPLAQRSPVAAISAVVRVPFHSVIRSQASLVRSLPWAEASGGPQAPVPSATPGPTNLVQPRFRSILEQRLSVREVLPPDRPRAIAIQNSFPGTAAREGSARRAQPPAAQPAPSAPGPLAAPLLGFRFAPPPHPSGSTLLRPVLKEFPSRAFVPGQHRNAFPHPRGTAYGPTAAPPRPTLPGRTFPSRRSGTSPTAVAERRPTPLPLPLAAPPRTPTTEPGTEWIRSTRREVTETVLREVQTTVEREVVRRLQPQSDEFRRLGEALYSDLGSRMAFERERLGVT